MKHTTFIQQRAVVSKVACDCCRGTGQPAVKSCLKCEVSLCQEHVKDHEQLPAFRRHPLVNAVPNLSKRKCPKHDDEVLRYYCEVSRCYLCVVCVTESQQQAHLMAACAGVQQTLTVRRGIWLASCKRDGKNPINGTGFSNVVYMRESLRWPQGFI